MGEFGDRYFCTEDDVPSFWDGDFTKREQQKIVWDPSISDCLRTSNLGEGGL
ncbi:hypothetical protein KI387_019720, partial [Taxus chinensis]